MLQVFTIFINFVTLEKNPDIRYILTYFIDRIIGLEITCTYLESVIFSKSTNDINQSIVTVMFLLITVLNSLFLSCCADMYILIFLYFLAKFGTFETVSSGLADAFPQYFSGGKRKTLLTAGLCAVLFVLGIPFSTNVSNLRQEPHL